MNSAYLKIIIPLLFTTFYVHAQTSNLKETNPVDVETNTPENLFPNYDNRVKFGIAYCRATVGFYGLDGSAGSFGAFGTYERLKLDSAYFGVGAAIFMHGATSMQVAGGYNFLLSSKDRITPLAGLLWGEGNYFYPVIGAIYEHAFTERLRLGANFTTLICRDFNFSLGAPFTFQLDNQQRWEIEIQPSFSYAGNRVLSISTVGVQASIGYRF